MNYDGLLVLGWMLLAFGVMTLLACLTWIYKLRSRRH